MTRKEHLMVCLVEECNEVIHALSKCLRFGPHEIWPKMNETNIERVRVELNDLIAVAAMLVDEGFDLDLDSGEIEAKKEKVEKYIKYAQSLGITDE
jgi:NTP pyrophosphatase (non-canonical NTP hydrolase)